MAYISAKEAAERWHISSTRVVILARQGRIEGARLVGKSWMIPQETQKPSDMRKKSSIEQAAIAREERFRFPVYYSQEDLGPNHTLTPEEQILAKAEQQSFHGRYTEVISVLEQLRQTTGDRIIRIGALYLLAFCYLHSDKYEDFCHTVTQMKLIFTQDFPHKKEMEYLLHDLEPFFMGNHYYLHQLTIDPSVRYPEHMHVYLQLVCAYSAALRCCISHAKVDPAPYLLFCSFLDERNYPFAAISMHIYMGMIYMGRDLLDECLEQFRHALRLAEEYDSLPSIATFYPYAVDLFERAAQDRPELLLRIRAAAAASTASINGVLSYIGTGDLIQVLTAQDYEYLRYAYMGLTYKEVSERTHLSVVTICKRYAVLFEKTGTSNKKELAELFQKAVDTLKG